MNTQRPYVKAGVLETAQFLKDRAAAGLPVPTADQMKRAEVALNGNPMMRGYRTALGLVLMALRMPLSKREKMQNRRSSEDLEAPGLGLVLKPHRSRNSHLVVEADPKAVEAFVEANPGLTAQDAAASIAGLHGYTDLRSVLSRVNRYTRQSSDTRRPPGHIREKMQMLSAIAQAAMLISNRESVEQPA